MFLTRDQLEALTGYKKPALQRKWLSNNGYRFDVRADGRPAILLSQIAAKQGGARVSRAEPNWKALQ